MSYCRTSEPDSDVYVFGSGKYLECYVAWREAHIQNVKNSFLVAYDPERPGLAEKAMLGHLFYLRSQGIRVPDDALARLKDEIRETDPGRDRTQAEFEADLIAGEELRAKMAGALERSHGQDA